MIQDNVAKALRDLEDKVSKASAGSAPTLDPGIILAFSGADAPDGFLFCHGQAVSRSSYQALFKKIGISHGSGDGTSTFNIPDYRGRFLRGVDSGAGNDPDSASRTAMATGGNTGDRVGSLQGDAFSSHTHTFNIGVHNGALSGGSGAPYFGHTSTTDATGSNETRPKNAGIHFIIKT